MNIEGRIKNLERHFNTDPVTLLKADGTEVTIQAGQDGVMGIFRRALQDPDGPDAALIRESVSAREPGGGHMVELARAILLSPTEENA